MKFASGQKNLAEMFLGGLKLNIETRFYGQNVYLEHFLFLKGPVNK